MVDCLKYQMSCDTTRGFLDSSNTNANFPRLEFGQRPAEAGINREWRNPSDAKGETNSFCERSIGRANCNG